MSTLHERAEQFRARAIVRAWEHRQLRGSKGTWFRLRHVLALASEAYVVDGATIAALLAEGFLRAAVGDELEPPKDIIVVPRERAAGITHKRAVAVRLSADLLAARHIVLAPF